VGYGAALELVDVTRPPSDFESIVAGNIWHRAFATGPLHAEPPPEVVRAVVSMNGAVAGEGEQRADPLETARVVGELLRAVGEELRAGDLIIAGSIVHVPAELGDVVVELESLGAVGVRLG
jgi:2-keto-4-pentenoate hydratase